jgi:amino acid permease
MAPSHIDNGGEYSGDIPNDNAPHTQALVYEETSPLILKADSTADTKNDISGKDAEILTIAESKIVDDIEAGASQRDALPRTMGLMAATALVMGHVIGSGIFSTPAIVWSLTGSPGMALLIWLFGGMVAICGAVCFVELGTMLPNSGGEQAYLAYTFRRPRVLASYLFFWSLIM